MNFTRTIAAIAVLHLSVSCQSLRKDQSDVKQWDEPVKPGSVVTLPKASIAELQVSLLAEARKHGQEDDFVFYDLPGFAACAETAEIKHVYICFFNQKKHMNNALNRASTFIEVQGNEIVDHLRLDYVNRTGNVEGHNLSGPDLARFDALYLKKKPEFDAAVAARQYSRDTATVLVYEETFWTTFLRPKLKQEPDLIVLGVALDTEYAFTFDHEVLHAYYMRLPAMQKVVRDFFNTTVTAEDRQDIRDALAGQYDVTPTNWEGKEINDKRNELLINEFQAYILMKGAEENLLRSYVGKYSKSLREKLKAAGLGF